MYSLRHHYQKELEEPDADLDQKIKNLEKLKSLFFITEAEYLDRKRQLMKKKKGTRIKIQTQNEYHLLTENEPAPNCN